MCNSTSYPKTAHRNFADFARGFRTHSSAEGRTGSVAIAEYTPSRKKR
jgi:hypothetical protein